MAGTAVTDHRHRFRRRSASVEAVCDRFRNMQILKAGFGLPFRFSTESFEKFIRCAVKRGESAGAAQENRKGIS
jgi:hypothetical protein